MKKNVIVMLLVMAVSAVMLTGCSSTGGKNEITIIVKCPPNNISQGINKQVTEAQSFLKLAGESFAEQYEAADVTVDVQLFDYTDEAQVITECFDTNNAADVLFEGYFNMASYIHTGRVVPLDDIISDELRADINDAVWELSQVDGRTYMMPYMDLQNVLIYNKKMFIDCGLEEYVSDSQEIQSWSTEEFTYILDTLAANLPEGTYPMMMYAKNNQGDTHIMSLLRAYGCDIFDADGNFNLNSSEGIEALNWIQEGIGRGWFAPHCENMEILDNLDLFNSGKLAIYLYNIASKNDFDLNANGFVNWPTEDGEGLCTSFMVGFEVFDNGDADRLAASKAFVEYIYSSDEWTDLESANIPVQKSVSSKYSELGMLGAFADNAAKTVNFMNNSPNWQGRDDSVRSVFWPHIHELLAGEVTPEECARGIDADCSKAIEAGRKSSKLHE
ncbi:MAG: extracellular solute-binding protein [Bacillota bacterium]|nr:extracellular solute-binding protein [Bacillota bacterium]